MENTTPAFRLLCACCRWPPSPEKLSAVEQAVSGVDWDEFRTLTDFHRVYGLVYSTLCSTPVALPQAFKEWLADRNHAVARSNLFQLNETIRLQQTFAESGIDAMVVKGVALGQQVYGTVALKHSQDIDFVVPLKNIHSALSLAQLGGYQIIQPTENPSRGQIAAFAHYGKEFRLRKSSGTLLEIHSRLTDNSALLNGRLLNHTGQEISFGKTLRLRTLTDEDLFAYLCVHGASHNWARLKWLVDLNALLALASCEEGVVARFNARAHELGAQWCAVEAQLLCAELLGRPMPAAVATLARTARAQRTKRHCYHAMRLPARGIDPQPMRSLGDAIIQAHLGSGWRFWFGFIYAYSVQVSIIVELNLPERLNWAYPFVRPFFWMWFRWLNPRGRYRWFSKNVKTVN